MQAMLDLVTSWPTALYTTLLGVVLVYWILGLVGLVDIDHGEVSFESDGMPDGEADELLSTIAGYAIAFGLGGVPFSIVVSLLTLISWLITGLAAEYLLPLIPLASLRAIAGLAVVIVAIAPAIVITARLVRPLRNLFVQHFARSSESLVGLCCRVTTLTVSETFGQGEANDGNSSFNIRICAAEPNQIGKGTVVQIVEFDESSQRHRVVVADNN